MEQYFELPEGFMREGHMDHSEFTPEGVEFMSGLYCDTLDNTGKWLKFAS